jgi:hypothetical protein
MELDDPLSTSEIIQQTQKFNEPWTYNIKSPPEAGVLNKSSCLAAALSVTKS